MANVFDLQAKIGLNSEGFEKGIAKAGSAMKSMASGIANVSKIVAAGVGAAATGVAAIGKKAVESYADYEQLVGGVDTLFKDSSKKVQEYAANAYKTAGMSANEYMETVTSFSASLLQSMNGDTDAAAEKANMAITDMSDNANKMGSSMESIQNAYSGFAKQNYTMLDNLKLGYGGTQAEMKRLIEDAEKLNDTFHASRDENGDLTMSYSEIIDAIHIVQTNMDVTGTTAKEAATTISGSLSMVKASWENVLTGVADDSQDFDKLIDNLAESVDSFAGNIIPRIEVALRGVGTLIEKLVPTILERVPDLLNNTLPVLLQSALKLLGAVGDALVKNMPMLLASVRDLIYNVIVALNGDNKIGKGFTDIIKAFGKYLPQISEFLLILGTQIFEAMMNGISENADMVLSTLATVFNDVVGMISKLAPQFLELGLSLMIQIGQSIVENLPSLIETAVQLVDDFAQFIAENAPRMMPQIVELVYSIVEMLTNPDTMASLVDAAIIIIEAFAEGWINSMPVVLEHAPAIIENIVTAITENLPKILDCAGEVIDELVQGFLVNLPSILEAGGQILDELGTGITSSIMSLLDAWNRVDETLDNVFKEMWESAFASGKDLIDGFIKGIKEKWENLKETAIGAAQLIKDYLGFSEPKYGPLSNFHTYAPDMMELFSEGIKENTSKVTDQLSDSLSSVSNEFDGVGATDGAFSGTSNYYITITSGTISSDYDARRAAQQMSEELGNIKKFGNMAVGG